MSINHSTKSNIIRIVIEDEKLLRSNENLFFCTFTSNDKPIESPIPSRSTSKLDCINQGKRVLTFPINVNEFSTDIDSFFEQAKTLNSLKQIEGFNQLFRGKNKRPAQVLSSTTFFYIILRSAVDAYIERILLQNQYNNTTNVKVQLLTFSNFKKSASNNAMENRYHTTVTMDTDGFDPDIEHLNSTKYSSVGPMNFFLPRNPHHSLCKLLSKEIGLSRRFDSEDIHSNHWSVLFLKPNFEAIEYAPLVKSGKEFHALRDEISIRFSDLTISHMPTTNLNEILGVEKMVAMNYFARQASDSAPGNWLYVPIQQEDLKLFYQNPEDVLSAAIYLRKFRGMLPYAPSKTCLTLNEIQEIVTTLKVSFELLDESEIQPSLTRMYKVRWSC